MTMLDATSVARSGSSGDPAAIGETAVAVAASVVADARPTRRERRRAARMNRILGNAEAREVLMGLTDEVLRIHDARHAMVRLASLAEGDLGGFGLVDRTGLRLAATAGRVLPRVVKPLVDRRIVAETSGVIFPAGDGHAELRREGFSVNVNVLGESILGDDEADRRLADVLGRLADPGVDYVSVKISALCANLDVLAFDHSVTRISERLRTLYRAALARRPMGFVNLDMEEYRDLGLTIAAFTRVLDEPEFVTLPAGIVIQAYLPDSWRAMGELCVWAAARRDRGGAPVKVRLVKGANLAMEQVEAELAGWEQAPYGTKQEVDANFKRVLRLALDPAYDGAMRVGVGSHNLFDVGYAVTTARTTGQLHRLELEMLAGMAPAQARLVGTRYGGVRMYTPEVAPGAMDSAIAYLARRLDENAAPENFLRNLFALEPGSAAFEQERRRFLGALAAQDTVGTEPRRAQDRDAQRAAGSNHERLTAFVNTPDTDFTVPANRTWIERHLAAPPVVEFDACRTTAEIDAVLAAARTAVGWGDPRARRDALGRLAAVMADERGETLSLMAHTTGKTVREGDPEVSEAIDAVRYAATVGADLVDSLGADGLTVEPVGTVVVVAPWNFPYAIPTLAVATALVAGNSVILKPAPEALAVGAHLVAQCRRAGLPADAVRLVVCEDGPVGTHLVTHALADSVILTGSTATAEAFLAAKPSMHLHAETSGKNAIVVTDAADLDAAIRDVVRSAFGHAGQKCSAASLLILAGEVGRRADVMERLADAVRSVRVGPATDLATMTGPLIAPPSGKLAHAFDRLEPGQRWLVEPRPLSGDPAAATSWSPGVRTGVRPGSWFHTTECFGPVLGVMVADDLDQAIEWQNATGYGLTGGLHSLDPAEIEHWLRRVEAGNVYVNRHITGAIVQRQPFGGWKRSSVGGGSKPGGPDYILGFIRVTGTVAAGVAAASRRRAAAELYGVDTDPSALHSERNVLRHHPLDGVVVLTAGLDEPRVAALREAAAWAGTPIHLAADESEAAELLRTWNPDRLRVPAHEPSDSLLRAAHALGVAVDRTPVTFHGRVELGRWLKEQAISVSAHRHGRPHPSVDEPLRSSRTATPATV